MKVPCVSPAPFFFNYLQSVSKHSCNHVHARNILNLPGMTPEMFDCGVKRGSNASDNFGR